MFTHILRNNKVVKREYLIRGSLDRKPFEVTIHAMNHMDAVGLAKAQHPDMVITSIHVQKGVTR